MDYMQKVEEMENQGKCIPRDVYCEFFHISELNDESIKDIKKFIKKLDTNYYVAQSNDKVFLIERMYKKDMFELTNNCYLVYVNAPYIGLNNSNFYVYDEDDFIVYFL